MQNENAMESNVVIPNDFSKWSYSQHYFAENCGEEVIEHILQYSSGARARNILGAQLLDEVKHVKYYNKIIQTVGLDPNAKAFADGYVSLIYQQDSLCEKIFCFQILTEAISAALCQWRLDNLNDKRFFHLDAEVLADEEKHLKMGECLLNICDRDELNIKLSPQRQRTLVKEMNYICQRAFMTSPNQDEKKWINAMNRGVAKGLLTEARNIGKSINTRMGR